MLAREVVTIWVSAIMLQHYYKFVIASAVRNVASSYAAMRMVAGSRPVHVIV